MPNAVTDAYTNIDVQVELAKIAERGKIQMMFFFADSPALTSDISNQPPPTPMDPIVLLRQREQSELLLCNYLNWHLHIMLHQLKAI